MYILFYEHKNCTHTNAYYCKHTQQTFVCLEQTAKLPIQHKLLYSTQLHVNILSKNVERNMLPRVEDS